MILVTVPVLGTLRVDDSSLDKLSILQVSIKEQEITQAQSPTPKISN